MTKLYTMLRENIHTGERTIIYGSATYNVMDDYWQAHVDKDHRVIIGEWNEQEWRKEKL